MTNTWWSKTNLYDKSYIREMWRTNQREFWTYTQQRLFHEFNWNQTYPKQELIENKQNYLSLAQYKQKTNFDRLIKQENAIKAQPNGFKALKNQQLNKDKDKDINKFEAKAKLKQAIKLKDKKLEQEAEIELLNLGMNKWLIDIYKTSMADKISLEQNLKEDKDININ